MYPDSDKELNKETDDAVYFFTPAFHPLDNFSAHAIEIWNLAFPTAEHAYQWKKFSIVAPEVAQSILTATSPHIAKQIADANKEKIPVNWEKEKIVVMEGILKAKADQHEDVRGILKKTGEKNIIENSPVDNFWGIGPDGKGENMVGKIWAKIREEIL